MGVTSTVTVADPGFVAVAGGCLLGRAIPTHGTVRRSGSESRPLCARSALAWDGQMGRDSDPVLRFASAYLLCRYAVRYESL